MFMATHILAAAGDGTGIFGLIDDLSSQSSSSLKSIAVVGAVFIFVTTAFKSRFSVVPCILAAISAGFVLYVVYNPSVFKDMVGSSSTQLGGLHAVVESDVVVGQGITLDRPDLGGV